MTLATALAFVLAANAPCRATSVTEEQWQRADVGYVLTLSGDWDGDGKADALHAVRDGGTGGTGIDVRLTLSRLSTPITFSVWTSFYRIVNRTRIPKRLQGPGLARARKTVEEVLFPRICGARSPDLEMALGRRGRWESGTQPVFMTYAVTTGTQWVFYLGGNHGRRPAQRARSLGRFELWTTAHGAYWVDRQNARYRWAYVFRGFENHKFRWPSVSGVDAGGHLILRLHGGHTRRIALWQPRATSPKTTKGARGGAL